MRLNHACMSGPFDARMKYGKPTEMISNLKISSTGELTSCGFQLASGVIGDVQTKAREARRRIASAIKAT